MMRLNAREDRVRTWCWIPLAIGTLVFAVRLGGTSPLWSSDTINDEKFVRTCLDQNACYWFGMGTSVEWVVHGANFLHLKTALRAMGASDTVLHWILHAALALAVVFTAMTGFRLAGPMPGLLAATIVGPLWLATDLHLDVTYNHRALPFLGALILLLSVRAATGKRTTDLVLASSLAGLATNIHMECALFAAAVPFVAAWMSPYRRRAFFASIGSLAATAFLTSPDTWLWNLSALIHRDVSPPLASPAFNVSWFGVVVLVALATLIALAVARPTRIPRTWLLLPLLLGPKVIGTEMATLLGLIEPEPKYYIEVVPVVAVSLALLARALVEALGQVTLPLVHRFHVPRSVMLASLLAPGFVIAAWPVPEDRGPASRRALGMLSEREVQSLYHYMTNDLGWGPTAILRGLRGPMAFDALDLLLNAAPPPWRPEDSRQALVFAKVWTHDLPDPLPSGFRVLTSGDGASLVVQPLDTWLDMTHFRICVSRRSEPDSPTSCQDSGIAPGPWPPGHALTSIHGMPPVRRGQDVNLRVEFAVQFPPNATGVREVFMPNLQHGCSGRVLDARGGLSRVVEDGRGAILEGDGSLSGSLILEWRLGTRECGDWTYKGFVPFFIEGDPESVRTWKRLLGPLLRLAGPSHGNDGGFP